MLTSWLSTLFGSAREGRRERRQGERRQIPDRRAPAPQKDAGGAGFHPSEIAGYDYCGRRWLGIEETDEVARLRELVWQHFLFTGKEEEVTPPLTGRLMVLVDGGDYDVNKLVQLLSRDPLVSASVLKAANSAFFKTKNEVTGIRQAVLRLGTSETVKVAIASSVRGLFIDDVRTMQHSHREIFEELWLHSMVTASVCGWLALEIRRGDVERAFTGGMMHDIGKALALRSLAALSGVERAVAPRVLHGVLDSVHVAVGSEIVSHWRLPEYLVSICREHHEPDREGAGRDEVHLVRVVSGLDEIRTSALHREGLAEDVLGSAAVLGMTPFVLRATAEQIRLTAQRLM